MKKHNGILLLLSLFLAILISDALPDHWVARNTNNEDDWK
jgi:hypothetical protein